MFRDLIRFFDFLKGLKSIIKISNYTLMWHADMTASPHGNTPYVTLDTHYDFMAPIEAIFRNIKLFFINRFRVTWHRKEVQVKKNNMIQSRSSIVP